jgi:hypothetical protein
MAPVKTQAGARFRARKHATYIGATLAVHDIRCFFKYVPSPKICALPPMLGLSVLSEVNCKSAAIREGLFSWMQPPAGASKHSV